MAERVLWRLGTLGIVPRSCIAISVSLSSNLLINLWSDTLGLKDSEKMMGFVSMLLED